MGNTGNPSQRGQFEKRGAAAGSAEMVSSRTLIDSPGARNVQS